MARMSSTATGRSASCSGVWWWKIETSGPHGMTAKAMKAIVPDITGAAMNNSLSAVRGMMSSLSGSLSASAMGWSRPNGPARFGPGRFCIRPMTRRSAQIMKIVVSSRKRKTIATFSSTIHQMSWLKSLSVGSVAGAASTCRSTPASVIPASSA
jgi:hypothetical protein